jgi:rhodanese-related sulfurtransferase
MRFLSRILIVTFILLSIATGGLAFAQLGGLFDGPAVDTIETKELRDKLTQAATAREAAEQAGQPIPEPDFVLVDVRSDAEVKVSVIPGAITKTQYEKNRKAYEGKLVIPYCTIGGRSGSYAKQLKQAGVNVKNYKGSILEWVKADLPVVTLEGQPTNRVHIYSDRYKIPAKYEAVTQ